MLENVDEESKREYHVPDYGTVRIDLEYMDVLRTTIKLL